jgi:putative DNA primase/helicase
MDDILKLHETYRQNVTTGMATYLSDNLGVSVASLTALGLGYTFDKAAFTIPERDIKGNIIGLSYRFQNGKKGCEPGSKRGLVYPVNPDSIRGDKKIQSGYYGWVKLEKGKGLTCPICGKDDWCMVSALDPDNPPAVNCCRISAGSVSELGMGWLHILRPEGDTRNQIAGSSIMASEFPILVVEGMSDVAAAMDMGLVAIGRPSASAGLKLLKNAPLAGRKIIVVGERDAGAGEVGMEATFRVLKTISTDVRKVMPPVDIKDFRKWKLTGITRDQFLQYVDASAEFMMKGDVLESDVASSIAKQWIENDRTQEGVPTVRKHKGQWVNFTGTHYANYSEEKLRGDIYEYLEGKLYQQEDSNGNISIKPYKPTRAKINDILDALNQWCPVEQPVPSWLVEGKHQQPKDLIVFQNGILDVPAFVEGKIKLYDPTPSYFTFNALPYKFDEDAKSDLWTHFLKEVFHEPEQIDLLAEWMGYVCVPDLTFEKLMWFTGRPRSGKTTILDTIRAMLGPEQCAETSFQSLVGAFGFQPLMGKLVAMIGDAKTPRASESDSALEKILQVTGGDHVTINKKGVSQLASTQLYCRFTFAMNDLPIFTDFSRALEARLNILSFGKSFLGKEDRSLKVRLRREAASGRMTMFALNGLKRLRQNNQFTFPESSKDLTRQYSELSVPTIAFGCECLETESNSEKWTEGMWVSKDQVYDVWCAWCKARGQRCGGREQFGRWLQAAYPEIYTARRRIQCERTYGFAGVRIKESAIKNYLVKR